jgi:hypothetical protein
MFGNEHDPRGESMNRQPAEAYRTRSPQPAADSIFRGCLSFRYSATPLSASVFATLPRDTAYPRVCCCKVHGA